MRLLKKSSWGLPFQRFCRCSLYFNVCSRNAPHIVRKINADLAIALDNPDVRQKFETLGTYIRPLSPEETGAFIKGEQALWWPVVRAVNNEKK